MPNSKLSSGNKHTAMDLLKTYSLHKLGFKHLNFQYIYLISCKIAKKSKPGKMDLASAIRGALAT
jgi:hypothetical protein